MSKVKINVLLISFLVVFISCGPQSEMDKYLSLMQNGQYEEVIEELEKSIEVNPDYLENYIYLGQANCQSSNRYKFESDEWKASLVKAEEYFKKALRLDDNNPTAKYNLGMIYYLTDNENSGINCFEKVLQIDSSHVGSKYFLYRGQLNNGDYKKAEKCFRKIESYLSNQANNWKPLKLSTTRSFIVKVPHASVFEDLSSVPNIPKGAYRQVKTLNKYEVMNFLYKNEDKYFFSNILFGWVPEDKTWFRGVFEKKDDSDRGNVYDAPNGHRLKKESIRNLRRVDGDAVSGSGLNIIKKGWYKVQFESTHNLYINESDVVLGLGFIDLDEHRVKLLKEHNYWGKETIEKLLNMNCIKNMPKVMVESVAGYIYKYEFLPWGNKIKEKIYTQYFIFDFSDGQLVKWRNNDKILELQKPISISSKFKTISQPSMLKGNTPQIYTLKLKIASNEEWLFINNTNKMVKGDWGKNKYNFPPGQTKRIFTYADYTPNQLMKIKIKQSEKGKFVARKLRIVK